MKVGFFEFLLPYGVNYLFSRLNSDGERVRRIIFDSLHDCVRNLDLEEGTLSLAQATFSKKLVADKLTSARSKPDIEAIISELCLEQPTLSEIREELSWCVFKAILDNVPNMNKAIYEEIMSLRNRVDEGFVEVMAYLRKNDSFLQNLKDDPFTTILALQQQYLLEQGVGEIHTNLETGEQVFFLKEASGFTLLPNNDEAFKKFLRDIRKGNVAELDLTQDANVEFSDNIKSLFKNIEPQYVKVVPSPVTNTINLRYRVGDFYKVLNTLTNYNQASDCYTFKVKSPSGIFTLNFQLFATEKRFDISVELGEEAVWVTPNDLGILQLIQNIGLHQGKPLEIFNENTDDFLVSADLNISDEQYEGFKPFINNAYWFTCFLKAARYLENKDIIKQPLQQPPEYFRYNPQYWQMIELIARLAENPDLQIKVKVCDEVILKSDAIDLPFKEDIRNLTIVHPIKLDEVNVVERAYIFIDPQITLSKHGVPITKDNFEEMAEKHNRTFDMTVESDNVTPYFAPLTKREK